MSLTSLFHKLSIAFGHQDQEAIHDALAKARPVYSRKEPSEILTDMIKAQSVLFGGTEDQIRTGINRMCHEKTDLQKAAVMSHEMRESLTRHVDHDPTLDRIYNMIGWHKENTEQVWECLFTMAAEHKENQMEMADIFAARIYRDAQEQMKAGTDLETLQEEENHFLKVTAAPYRYRYFISSLALARQTTREAVEREIAMQCGSNDMAVKLRSIESDRAAASQENNNEGYGEINMEEIRQADFDLEMRRRITHPTTRKLQ